MPAERLQWNLEDRLILAVRVLEVRDRQPAGDPASVPDTGLAAPRARIDMRGAQSLRLDLGAQTAMPDEIFALRPHYFGDGGAAAIGVVFLLAGFWLRRS